MRLLVTMSSFDLVIYCSRCCLVAYGTAHILATRRAFKRESSSCFSADKQPDIVFSVVLRLEVGIRHVFGSGAAFVCVTCDILCCRYERCAMYVCT